MSKSLSEHQCIDSEKVIKGLIKELAYHGVTEEFIGKCAAKTFYILDMEGE
jgi:hypothetical protein